MRTCGPGGGQPGRGGAARQEDQEPERAPQNRHSSGRPAETRLRPHSPFARRPSEDVPVNRAELEEEQEETLEPRSDPNPGSTRLTGP